MSFCLAAADKKYFISLNNSYSVAEKSITGPTCSQHRAPSVRNGGDNGEVGQITIHTDFPALQPGLIASGVKYIYRICEGSEVRYLYYITFW